MYVAPYAVRANLVCVCLVRTRAQAFAHHKRSGASSYQCRSRFKGYFVAHSHSLAHILVCSRTHARVHNAHNQTIRSNYCEYYALAHRQNAREQHSKHSAHKNTQQGKSVFVLTLWCVGRCFCRALSVICFFCMYAATTAIYARIIVAHVEHARYVSSECAPNILSASPIFRTDGLDNLVPLCVRLCFFASFALCIRKYANICCVRCVRVFVERTRADSYVCAYVCIMSLYDNVRNKIVTCAHHFCWANAAEMALWPNEGRVRRRRTDDCI